MRTPEILRKLLPKRPPKDPFKEGALRFFQTGEDPHLQNAKLYMKTLLVQPDEVPNPSLQDAQADEQTPPDTRGRS